MITCQLMGGLGNQLFQIFTTITCSMMNKIPFKFANIPFTGGQGATIKRDTYWQNILSKLQPFLSYDFPQMQLIKENGFTYSAIPISSNLTKDICLFGYFQSYKYFQNTYSTIYRLLDIDNKKKQVLNLLYTEENINNLDNTISLHFRLGDYKKLPDYHPIMNYNYYKNALNTLRSIINNSNSNKLEVLYFCEDEDIDIVNEIIYKLNEDFPDFQFKRVPNSFTDWQQLLLMSCCKYNIIANSSFSWWSAYLNTNEDKLIFYPYLWFGPSAGHDTKDMCPPDWIKIHF